ncbi:MULTISPECIES: alpha/beta hydrolase [Pseudomonas]|uniref:alpha/beta hydrolase n=1 Tax=Pseudomonas TaxID=286 RepID=UPI00048923D8|nr:MULTISPECIES: dienelactone hydrolase family protein [Pseudomonas]PRA48309.1 phospholipase [Pseudomonas sp. MYb115]QXN52028.1 dienelactone hydrolase family protein [Pseudomonas fluorescens]WSO26356.1 dienelactone hydrolase family protein [Pseudomonas fluorescens]
MLKTLAAVLMLGSSIVQAEPLLHTDLPLNYLEQSQPDSRNQPLVIFLHGYGSNEADLFGIKDGLPASYTYLSVRAPQTLEEGSYQWFHRKGQGAYDGDSDDLRSSAALIGDFVAKAADKYHTTADKVFLVGFSQGAIMSYEVALRQPSAVGGIAALSGKLLPVLRTQLKADKALGALAIFIGHGTDDQRLPFADGSDADSLLRKLGLAPQFHAYPGLGHSISEGEISDLNAWLLRINR